MKTAIEMDGVTTAMLAQLAVELYETMNEIDDCRQFSKKWIKKCNKLDRLREQVEDILSTLTDPQI